MTIGLEIFFVGKRAGQYEVGPDDMCEPTRWGTDTSRSSSSYIINRPQRMIWNQWTTDFVLVKLIVQHELGGEIDSMETIPVKVRIRSRLLVIGDVH